MQRLSKVFRDQPEKPLDRAVWWIEWVLRNPDVTYLQSHAVEIGWLKMYAYDVLIFLFVAVAITSHVIVGVTYRIACKKRSGSRKLKNKQA